MSNQRRVGLWRQLVLLALFLGLTVFVVLGFTNAREFGKAIANASWHWMVLSVFLFALSFYLWALLYRVGLAAAGVASKTFSLLAPLMVSIFLNTAAPVGEAIFVEHAVEHRQSGPRAAAGTILVLVVDLATTIPFIAASLAFLHSSGKLPVYYVVVSALFILVIALFVAALWVGKVRRSWLETALRWAQRAANWVARLFRRRERKSDTWAARNAGQFSEASASMARRPGLLALSIAVGLLFHLVNAAGLYTLCLALGHRVSWGVVTAAFTMSIVLYVIAITPQGVGPTESVMVLLFTKMGVGSAIAVAIAVTYRIFNIWIPILLGYLFARRMRIFGGRVAAEDRGAG